MTTIEKPANNNAAFTVTVGNDKSPATVITGLWKSLLSELPRTADIRATIKVKDRTYTCNNPKVELINCLPNDINRHPYYRQIDFVDFETDFPTEYKIVDPDDPAKIVYSDKYRISVKGRLCKLGNFYATMTASPNGEAPIVRHYISAEYGDNATPAAMIRWFIDEDKHTTHIVDWLADFRKSIIGQGFRGKLKVGCSSTELSGDDSFSWAKQCKNATNNTGVSAATISGEFRRPCHIRSDFEDIVTVKVTSDRHVFVEFKSVEIGGEHVVGIGHGGKELALTSELFPSGFYRSEQDFLVRHFDPNKETSEMRPYVPKKKVTAPIQDPAKLRSNPYERRHH